MNRKRSSTRRSLELSDIDGLLLPADFLSMPRAGDPMRSPVCGIPSPRQFVRSHPDPTMRFDAIVLEQKLPDGRREYYLVDPVIVADPRGGVHVSVLHRLVDRLGTEYVTPVWAPRPGSRWAKTSSPLETAFAHARETWVQIFWSRSEKRYDVRPATTELPDPRWSDRSMDELVELAFADRLIDDPEDLLLIAALEA